MELGNLQSIHSELNKITNYSNTNNSVPIFFVGYLGDELQITNPTDVNTFNNLLKPIDPQSLKFAIELAFEKSVNQVGQLSTKEENVLQIDNKLLVKRGNELVKVVVDDIFYIESEDKYCYIHTENTRFLVQKSLKSFAETLPENFVQLHRKNVVNINRIKSVFPADYTLTLKNNITLPVSQRHRKLLLEIFTIIK